MNPKSGSHRVPQSWHSLTVSLTLKLFGSYIFHKMDQECSIPRLSENQGQGRGG